MSDREDFFGPGCTCRLEAVHATDIDPPDVKVDRNCLIHGNDPDRAYDEWRDAQWEDR